MTRLERGLYEQLTGSAPLPASCLDSGRFSMKTFAAAALLLLTACEVGLDEGGPSAICREAGVQCVLPAGPLGVCESARCAVGQAPPCFQCTPQH